MIKPFLKENLKLCALFRGVSPYIYSIGVICVSLQFNRVGYSRLVNNNDMADKQTFMSMGYEETDGQNRLESLLATVKHINFYKIIHPDLYREYYDTDDPDERNEVRERTPSIDKDEYYAATVQLFLQKLQDTEWYAVMDGVRILFHNPIGKSYFQVSNDKLGLFLTLYAEKLGMPLSIVQSASTPKALMGTLKYRVRLDELRSDLDQT